MKYIKVLIISILFSPILVLAYSENIIPGGENIGIEAHTEGIIVVGFYKVNGKYIGRDTLNVGDTILKIEGVEVSSIKEMSNLIDKNIKNNKVNILIKRNNKEKETTLNLVKEGSIYKTGLYVKEKITGIGTLSYIDPSTRIFGSLGHEIAIRETNNKIEIKKGEIYESYVNSIDRSIDGRVGSKNANINYSTSIGEISKNTSVGLFGKYTSSINKETIPVAKIDEVLKGKAMIYTVTKEKEINTYEIEITNINKNLIKTNKCISFKITDKKLLEEAGGIVQGMSGSPIIQNNKIIGSVTHVVVNDVKTGYAVFIRTMLEEGEK
jgi:stage IV sporulation protein B